MSTPRGRLATGIAASALAAAAVGFAAPGATAAPTASPSPAPGQCVGLVVDSGQGGPSTACVPFRSKLSGQDLLVAAGRKLTFDQHGFICRIDGYPANCTSDNTHYWSYFHRAPGAAEGKWAYSQVGASSYFVHPGETEGWAYQNGSTRQPPPIPYPTLEQAAASDGGTPSSGASPAASGATSAGHDGGSSPWPVAAVIALVVVLAGAAGRMALRRRRA